MKKNLFIAMFLPAALAIGQTLYVSPDTDVKVESNTLLYVNGDAKVDNFTASATQTFSNEGNVNVRGNFDAGATQETNFVNEYTSGTAYGQLIIASSGTSTGDMVHEWTFNNGNQYMPTGMPFQSFTAQDITDDLNDTNGTSLAYYGYTGPAASDLNRYKTGLFYFKNSVAAGADAYMYAVGDAATTNSPFALYLINNNNWGGIGATELFESMQTFDGVASNTAETVTTTGYTIPGGGMGENNIGELYRTMIDDAFVPTTAAWDASTTTTADAAGRGDNVYYFGNPYTSNLDVSGFSSLNIEGIFTFAENLTWDDEDEDSAGGTSQDGGDLTYDAATLTSGAFAGSIKPLLIKPYGTFMVKTKGGSVNFAFDDAMKTFGTTPAAPGTTSRNANNFYQLKIQLYTEANEKTANSFYVVAANDYQAENLAGNQAYANHMGNNNGLYTLEEAAEGGSANMEGKLYINGINKSDFIAKAIPVALNINEDAPMTTFRIKASLRDSNLGYGNVEGSFADGNKYYFEDKLTGEVMEITSDFDYTFTATEDTTDRFNIYWNGTPENLGTNNATLASTTIVYKDADDYKVRFAAEWDTADVYVYNIAGQLVHSAKSVNTTNDYVLPLRGNKVSAYIVKTVGDNGQVVSKKIVK